MPSEYLETLAVVATRLPKVPGARTAWPAQELHRHILGRLETFATIAGTLPPASRRELVQEAPASTGNLWEDHVVALYARKVAYAMQEQAPAWTSAPSLAFYLEAELPYNACDQCLGAGETLVARDSDRLRTCPECRGVGLVLTPGLTLISSHVLRNGPPAVIDRTVLAGLRTDEDMVVSADLLVRRYRERDQKINGPDPESKRKALERFRAYRYEFSERSTALASVLAIARASANAEYQDHDLAYKGALKRLVNPFAYLGNEANRPRDPGPLPAEWKAAHARFLGADAAVERHQRWVQAVHKRDAKVQRRLERAAGV